VRWLAGACLAVAAWAGAAEQVVLEEDTPAWHTLQGNVLLSERKYESAMEQYRRALAIDSSYFYAQFNIALASQSLGRLDEARRWYEEAQRTRPDHHEVVCNLGFLSYRAGDWQAAARCFQDAANLAAESPSDAADYWFNLGTARERLGEFQEARRAYEGSLQISANHGAAHYNLGTLFLGPLAEEPDALGRAQSHLEQALKAAMAVKKAVEELNRVRLSEGGIVLEMGIGLDSGEVIAGNMGSMARMEYTAVGDTVNLASRLTDLAAGGDILVSEFVFNAVRGRVEAEEIKGVVIKGFDHPVTLYNIRGFSGAWAAEVEGIVHLALMELERDGIVL